MDNIVEKVKEEMIKIGTNPSNIRDCAIFM